MEELTATTAKIDTATALGAIPPVWLASARTAQNRKREREKTERICLTSPLQLGVIPSAVSDTTSSHVQLC